MDLTNAIHCGVPRLYGRTDLAKPIFLGKERDEDGIGREVVFWSRLDGAPRTDSPWDSPHPLLDELARQKEAGW
jgi:hypothetical protein